MPALCAVIITHHPEPGLDLAGHVTALREQEARVLLVDNGSTAQELTQLKRLVGEPGVDLLANPENRGLAAALNQGVEWAEMHGFEWLAVFDQDSRIAPGYFRAMQGAVAVHPQSERLAIIAPRLWHDQLQRSDSFAVPEADPNLPYAPAWQAITSGSLMPVRLFKAVGPFRADFFIDYVDHEFCLRCRQRGWLVIEARGALLQHRLGTPVQHRLGWMRPVVTHHPPLRHYYRARNRMAVYRQYGGFDLYWLARDLKETLRNYAKLVLFEKQRGAKLAAILRGCWHGLTGRMGVAP